MIPKIVYIGPTVYEAAERRIACQQKEIERLQNEIKRNRQLLSNPSYAKMLESERIAHNADVFLPPIVQAPAD